MKTRYILNSGASTKYPQKTQKYIEEILRGLNENQIVKILVCTFALQRELWESTLQKYAKSFEKYAPENMNMEFTLAAQEAFLEQVKKSDVVIITGGDDEILLYRLEKCDLKSMFDGKVVATSSAGSNILSSSFWACDWRKCMVGAGILPIKFLPHYRSGFGADDPRGPIDWEKASSNLAAYGDTSLPIHALEEGEFVIYEID